MIGCIRGGKAAELLFQLFDTGIPWTVIGITILIAFITTCIVAWKQRENRRKYVLMVWIVACLFLMLYSTVLGREARESVSVHIAPIWSVGAIKEGLIEVLYEKIYNVLFFVPYGVLLGAYRCSSGSSGSSGFNSTFLLGCLTSITIELLQLITRTGTCETDDVICNTLGCAVGAGIATSLCWLIGIVRNN